MLRSVWGRCAFDCQRVTNPRKRTGGQGVAGSNPVIPTNIDGHKWLEATQAISLMGTLWAHLGPAAPWGSTEADCRAVRRPVGRVLVVHLQPLEHLAVGARGELVDDAAERGEIRELLLGHAD